MIHNLHKKKVHVYVIELSLFLPNCHSLKEKRKILQSLKFKLKNSFNISVAENGASDLWQRAELMVAAVGEKNILEKLTKDIIKMVSGFGSVSLIDSKLSCY